MRFLSIIVATLLTTCLPAHAGFQGVNGVSNLGVFNKLTCSTGLTCTKNKDSFSIVSSPSISSGAITVKAASSTAATVDIQANNNASNGDDWQLSSTISQGGLSWLNNISGSQVSKMSLSTGGNLSCTGTFTPAGALIPNGGITPPGPAFKTRFSSWAPEVVTNATSVTGSATVVYLTQMWVPYNVTFTGVGILNAATVGTNKYIVALFNDAGVAVANSSTAGVTTAGASAYQQVPFTGTYSAIGPRTYWIGLYINGATDTYYSMPSLAQAHGLAGSVSAQTFGTVANVTLPTTFTAALGPVAYVY